METVTLTKSELKALVRETVKETLAEIMTDKAELLEAMEDYSFGRLMEEADNGDFVSEEEIHKALNS
ncbi:MAG TPA: hypothetical protein PK514_05985 [Spirochaetota bacterium]|nr:hypothetical protein [Spirochaetota bacterium]